MDVSTRTGTRVRSDPVPDTVSAVDEPHRGSAVSGAAVS